MSEAEVREEWEAWREKKGIRRLVMSIAMADAGDPETGLEEQMLRLRVHNRAVAELLDAAQQDAEQAWGRLEKYLKAGVLVTVATDHLADALKLAVQVMRAFDDGPHSMWNIRPMIAITRGEVIDLADVPPADLQGQAVEQAVRLIYEIARPNQILVERELVEDDALDDDVELRPLEGKQKAMVGAAQPLTVSELVWSEAEAAITNRWLLNDDLLRIQRAALDLLTEMSTLQWDHRASIYKSTLDDGEIDKFKRAVKALEKHSLTVVHDAWDRAEEANDDDDLEASVHALRETYGRLLDEFERYLGTSSEKADAVGKLRDTWSAFEDAANTLSDDLQHKLQQNRMSHV